MTSYTLERRPDTNVSNTTLGLWLFLASEVMLFGAVFSAYALLRVSAAAWPAGPAVLNVPLGGLNTALLLTSSVILWRVRSSPLNRARRGLAVNSLLAIAFLAVKAVEYSGEIGRGLVPAASTFLATYFTLTGLHALHVLGGLAANAWALAGRAGPAMTANRIRLLSIYWVFVDVLWIIIFVLVYLS